MEDGLIWESAAAELTSGTAQIGATRLLRGANIYHPKSVFRQEVDLGPLALLSTAQASADFADRFADRFLNFRTLAEQDEDGAFLRRLRAPGGVPVEEALLQATLAVEQAALTAMHYLERAAFAAILYGDGPSRIALVWECQSAWLSRAAGQAAFAGLLELLDAPLPAGAPGFETTLAELLERAGRRRLSPTTAVLRLAAKRRGLPIEVVSGQHLRLGHGSRQHHLYSSMSSFTATSATKLAADKRQTSRRLRALNLPAPEQHRADSLEKARKLAKRLDGRIVIKPNKGSRGQGVTAGLRQDEDIAPAYERAAAYGSQVLVERHVEGIDHRLLVVGGKFVAALHRRPPQIVGDGSSTVRVLIDALNRDPFRDGFRLFKVPIDAELLRHLEREGLTLESRLEDGRVTPLRTQANVSTGGEPVDVTDIVHPDNIRMAEDAAQAIGLDVAGIDFITSDISRSWREIGGGIIEVNARPGVCMHTWPRHGASRDVAGAILARAFPTDDSSTAPCALVCGDRGTGILARALHALLQGAGRTSGLALKNSAYLGETPFELPAEKARSAPRRLLSDPKLDCLVAAVSLRRTGRHGLGLDGFDAAAILPRVHDADIEPYLQGLDVLVKSGRGRFVTGSGHLAALRPLAALPPERLILTAVRPNDAVAQEHIAAGGAAVLYDWQEDGQHIVAFDQGAPVLDIPAGAGLGRRVKLRDQETLLQAVGLALALGVTADDIATAMKRSRRRRRKAATSSEPEHVIEGGRGEHLPG